MRISSLVSIKQRHQPISVFLALVMIGSGLVALPFSGKANGGPEVVGDLSSVCAATSSQTFEIGLWDHSSNNLPAAASNTQFASPGEYSIGGGMTSTISGGVARISGLPSTKDSSKYLSLPITTSVDSRIVLSGLSLATGETPVGLKVSAELYLLESPIQSQISSATFAEAAVVSSQTQRFEMSSTLLRTNRQYYVRVFFWDSAGLGTEVDLDSISLDFKKCLAGAPTSITYTPSDTSIRVEFTAPANTGTSTITNYEYSLDSGSNWQTPSPAVTSSPLTIQGLSTATTYQVQTRAVTAAGGGGVASATTSVTTTGSSAPAESSSTVARQVGVFFVGQTYAPVVLDLSDTSYELDNSSTLPTDVTFSSSSKTLTVTAKSSNVGKFSFTLTSSTRSDSIAFEGYIAHFVLDNGKLRFGAMLERGTPFIGNAVNEFGNLTAPHYFSPGANRYYQLTYSSGPNYPLNMAIGMDTSTPRSGMWNENQIFEIIDDDSSVSRDSQRIDLTGFNFTTTSSSSFVTRPGQSEIRGIRGTGVIKSTSEYTLNPSGISRKIRVVNTYTLQPGESYVRIQTSVTNISSAGELLEDLNIWVGTQDDYVGTQDSVTKTKGNLLNGAFTAISNQSDRSDSILIDSGAEGVLFHSPNPGTNTIIDDCCSFSNSYQVNPLESPIQIPTDDGSYAAFVPLATSLAPQASKSITWFYAAGATADLGSVATAVSEESAEVAAEQAAEEQATTPPTTSGGGGFSFPIATPPPVPSLPPPPSRPSTRPSLIPSPLALPSPPATLGPIALLEERPAVPNVRYGSTNPIPRYLMDVLARPLGYTVEQTTGAPILPELTPTESLAYENGSPIQIQLVRTDEDNGYVLIGDGWQVALEAADSAGAPLRIDDSGNIILNRDRFVQFSGSGFAPGSIVKVWLFSDPTEVSEVIADASGNFVGEAQLPEGIPVGQHTVQLNGLTENGQLRSVSLGVVVEPVGVVPTPVPFDFSGLMNMLWILAAGVLFFFFILWRRRKKEEEEVLSPVTDISEDLILASDVFEVQPTQQFPNDSRRKIGAAAPPNRKRFGFNPKGA